MFDFALFLVLATAITGVICLLNLVWLEPKRKSSTKPLSAEPAIVEYAKAFFPVLLIVLLLRSFIVEPFRIPSGSMLPTLQVGDFILVNKFSYGLRLPVTNTKIVPLSEPERGDVVVFKYPEDPRLDYIKRIVGLPGDTVAYQNKQLMINGQPMTADSLGPYNRHTSRGGPGTFNKLEETLGTMKHNILLHPGAPSQEFELRVPEGHYFVMGDNRDDSRDSRVWGFLPESNLVGKAFVVWMHWDFGREGPNLGRIGKRIR